MHFELNTSEVRSIRLPGEPMKTRRRTVSVINGKGTKIVEDLSPTGKVLKRIVKPIHTDHMNEIMNNRFVPRLFDDCIYTTAVKKNSRKTTRRSKKN